MILSRKTTRTAAKCADTSTENSDIDKRKLRLEKVTKVLHIKSAKFTAKFNHVFKSFSYCSAFDAFTRYRGSTFSSIFTL